VEVFTGGQIFALEVQDIMNVNPTDRVNRRGSNVSLGLVANPEREPRCRDLSRTLRDDVEVDLVWEVDPRFVLENADAGWTRRQGRAWSDCQCD
jgi:hypothetical protein